MYDLTLTWRPYRAMSLNNPIEYLFTSDRLTRPELNPYDICDVVDYQYTIYDNIYININSVNGAPVGFVDSITIAGDEYLFVDSCFFLLFNSPFHIDMSDFIASGDYCDLAASIIKSINNNPLANGRYFAVDIGEFINTYYPSTLTSPSTCTATTLNILIISKNIDLDLNVTASGWAAYPGNTPFTTYLVEPAINYFTDYRIYMYIFAEWADYDFDNFSQSKKITTLPLPPPPKNYFQLYFDVEKNFLFDIRNQLRSLCNLSYDLVDLTTDKLRFCFRCVKQYYIAYGDQKTGVGDGDVFDVSLKYSKYEYDIEGGVPRKHLVLNSNLPLDNYYYQQNYTNGFSCTTNPGLDYQLENYFKDDPGERWFLFTTNKVSDICEEENYLSSHKTDYPLFLHWYNDSLSDCSIMRLKANYYYNDGTVSLGVNTGFDFCDADACEQPTAFTQQILQIPVQSYLDLTDVKEFDLYLAYSTTPITNILKFMLLDDCEPTINFCYVNRFGVYQMLYVEGNIKESLSKTSLSYFRNQISTDFPRHYTKDINEFQKYIESQSSFNVEILLNRLTSKESFNDLLNSPDVRILLNDELIPVIIEDSNFQVETNSYTEIEFLSLTLRGSQKTIVDNS